MSSFYTSRPSLLAFGMLLIAELFANGCGTVTSDSKLTGPISWAATPTCTAGDTDNDLSCDDVDPDPNDSDTDDDGALDGTDVDPKNNGTGDGAHLSPLMAALGQVAAVALAGSMYPYTPNFSKNCKNDDDEKDYCVNADWSDVKITFTNDSFSAEGEDYDGQMKIKLKLKVQEQFFASFGVTVDGEQSGTVEFRFNYRMELGLLIISALINPPDSTPGKGDGITSLKVLYKQKSILDPDPDPSKPIGTGFKTELTPDGCNGRAFKDDESTGAVINFTGDTVGPYCLSSKFLKNYPQTFNKNAESIQAVFAAGSVYHRNTLRLTSADLDHVLTLPESKIFTRNGSYKSINPLAAEWK